MASPGFFRRFTQTNDDEDDHDIDDNPEENGDDVSNISHISRAKSITPVRRRRSDDDVDGDSAGTPPISVDGEELSPESHRTKRARHEDSVDRDDIADLENEEGVSLGSGDEEEEEEEEEEDSEQAQLLPDNYLRSPRRKQRAPMVSAMVSGASDPVLRPHQPGAIVRVKLTDFVTYTQAEFHPGPNLNMIIGPNGTGKSTLVCAICLGLGWKTSHLGRAKDIGEFVKHGKQVAMIEIELARDPGKHQRNPIITTKIIRDGNKTEFMINGEKSNNKKVLSLAREFSIQVDNLCQFLPQDRVVEFAALSPVELLAQTQRAAAPEQMTLWHEQLKMMRKDQRRQQDQQQSKTEELKNKEHRQRTQEADVARLRERSALQTRVTGLELLRPFPLYSAVKKDHTVLTRQQKAAARALSDLERQLEPNLRAVKEKETYLKEVEVVESRHGKLLHRTENLAQGHLRSMNEAAQKIVDCKTKTDLEREALKTARSDVARYQQQIASIDRTLAVPLEAVDHTEMNELIRQKRDARQEIASQIRNHREQIESFESQIQQRETIISRVQTEQASLQTQPGQQEAKLKACSSDTFSAWKWIQANRNSFKSKVFGPPVLECSIKDTTKAAQVESILGQADITAFTVTNDEDFRMLNRQLRDRLRLRDVNVRSIKQPRSQFRPPCSADRLSTYHMEGWIIDLLEGPDEVLAMLCDNKNLHQTAYTSRDTNDEQYKDLERGPISSWVTSTSTYQITRRREYGDKASSVRTNALRRAQFFDQGSGNVQVDAGSSREAGEARREIDEEIQPQLSERRTAVKQLQQQEKQLENEERDIKDQKNRAQMEVSNRQSLVIKRDDFGRKKSDSERGILQARGRAMQCVAEKDLATLEKGQAALNYANTVEQLRLQHIKAVEHAIWLIEAQSDLEQLRARSANDQAQITSHQEELEELTRAASDVRRRGLELSEECKRIGGLPRWHEDLIDLHEEINGWSSEQLETEIQSTQARLEMTAGGANMNILVEFEQRARAIEELRALVAGIQERLSQLEDEIKAVRDQWEPRLDALVAEISAAFGDNFAKIQCAGEVGIHKDEDFESWSIQIKVKFREHEQMSILDAHRQSGGERAVSTIFYLIALQTLARAPFRVVDEINQGMDPRNERLVHARMVDIACADRAASQYFLITPKLLSHLAYHPHMKVHCIASGEYMPADPEQLNFAALARRALEVRAAQQQGVAG
nr:structural maintenance of chromosomes protein 5 [Quercus suber]